MSPVEMGELFSTYRSENICLSGVSEGVCPLRNSSWSFLHCPEEDECANGHHHCNSTQDCHDLAEGYHCTCKQGYILSR